LNAACETATLKCLTSLEFALGEIKKDRQHRCQA
jgi:hypothetical protein